MNVWRAALVVVLAGCSNEVSGPTPSLPATQSPLSPTFVCNEQVETWVTISGEDFSPLVTNALNEPTVVNPTVILTRSGEIEGGSATGEPIVLDGVSEARSRVRWYNDKELQLQIDEALALEPGVYDLTVQNENGESASSNAALGVLPRPSVTALEPSYTCLAQGGRELAVVGDHFLVQDGVASTVMIGETVYTPTASEDCRDLAPIFGGAQVCQRLVVALAEGDFEPGLHDVVVQNAAPAACESIAADDGSQLLIVPPPTLTQVEEELTCVAQGERTFVARGTDFIQATNAPTVTVDGKVYQGTVSDCVTVETYGDSFERCTEVTFSVPQLDLPDGIHGVVVNNPDPAGCESSEVVELTVTPPPTISAVAPGVLCSEQLDNVFVISGEGFITVDGLTPSVEIDGQTFTTQAEDCAAVPSVLRTAVSTCNTLNLTIPAGTISAGNHRVLVTNPDPAGCVSESAVDIVFIPPPTVTEVVRDFICIETTANTFSVEGTGYLVFEGINPTVSVGGVQAAVLSVDGCSDLTGVPNAQLCTTISLDLAEASLGLGVHDVVVTNPSPAGCSSTEDATMETYPAPVVTAASPTLFCTDAGATTLTVTGQNFFVVDGVQPAISLGGSLIQATATAASCTATGRAGLETCTELTAQVPQNYATISGVNEVSVFNPDPVSCGASMNFDVLVGGPPNVTSVTPMAVCAGDQFDGMVTASGTAFLKIDGVEPTVLVEGQSVAGVTSDCVAVTHDTYAIETCNTFSFVVPLALRGSDSTFTFANPAPVDCGTSTYEFVLAPTPTIASVTPLRLCDQGGVVQITGTNFESGLEVTLGMQAATSVVVNPEGTTATATFAMTTEGLYNLQLRNPTSGCSITHNEQVRVVTGPRAFYVDPPVLYDGVSTQVTIYLTGLFGGSVTAAEIVDTAGNVIPLTNLTFDPAKPNTVQAIVPQGSLPENTPTDIFDVILTDDVSCSEQSPDLVSITEELTVAIEEIDPPFGWTNSKTDITVTSPTTLPAGQVNFEATPRIYLNPENAGAGDVATEVRAVQFVSGTELTGVVPEGLPVRTYDVIVINPDGSVGLLPGGFDVTAEPPPVVNTVSPGSWKTNEAAYAIVVEGANFRSVALEVTCLSGSSAVITVTGNTSTTVNATVNTGTLSHLDVCVMRLTNTDDGTYVDYAPITVTNPAGNFVSFSAGTQMVTGRRAPAVEAAPVTRSARYLYAAGGDTGTSATPLSSVETTNLDRFGRPGAWFELAQALPSGRTLAQLSRVEDFLYLAGGRDSEDATAAVTRALVLNPLDTVSITNVEFDIDPMLAGGVAPGVYYYRVAPVMPASYAPNPGGEMLASERQPVRIPFQGIDLLVAWTPYAGAESYRIYRSPIADAAAGQEELLAELPATATSYIDNGSIATVAEYPLPLGSLGEWHDVLSLAAPRHSHGQTLAVDPANPSLFHIYVVGGTNSAGGLLNSVERVSVTVNGPKDQTLVTAPVTATIGTARTELQALTANPDVASFISSGNYVFALGGRTAAQFSKAQEYALVQAGGDLLNFTATSEMQVNRAGYGAAVANNNIVVACGQNGTPNSSAHKSAFLQTTAPELGGSSSLSNVNLQNRYLLGSVSFGGVMYAVGGQDGASAASRTMDYSTLGGTP